jgi:hypothetical protein
LVYVPENRGAISPSAEELAIQLGAVVDGGPADYVWATASGQLGDGFIYSWLPDKECQVSRLPALSELAKTGAAAARTRPRADPIRFKELQREFDQLHEQVYASREPIDGSNDLTAQLCKCIFLKMHLERHRDFRPAVGGPLFEEIFRGDYIRQHGERAVEQIKKAFEVARSLPDYCLKDDVGRDFRIFDPDDFIKFQKPETYARVADMLYRHQLTTPEETGVEDDVIGRAFDVMLRAKFESKGGMGIYLHVQDPPCVHGDLKLDNVLLGNGGAHLVDFGQSRTIEDRFVETDGIGAWPYLAPEVMGRSTDGRGQRYVSSDIYAFGVIAYRFLTGRFPRRTISEAINLSPFPRPVELNPSVPAILDAFVLKCLERRPENRYPTGAALLAAIDHLQRELVEKAAAPITTSVLIEPALQRPVDELAEIARELIAEGKVDDAIAQLERAMRRTATSPQMLLVYAQAAKRVGRLDAANAVYRRAISWLKSEGAQDHELRDPVEGLAELDVQLKKYEPAAEGFAWLSERWPEKRWYRFRHGIALGLGGASARRSRYSGSFSTKDLDLP